MKALRLMVVGLVLAWTLSGCSPLSLQTPSEIHILAQDSAYTVWLKVGQILAVSLESNPSTGYIWEQTLMAESDVLVQVGESMFEPNSGAVGAPGTETHRFRAMRAGQMVLRLIYHRPWENAEPLNTFELNVIVEG